MSSVDEVLSELEMTPSGERVSAAQSTLVAIYAGLMEDPDNRLKTRCVDIIREGCLDAMRVGERNGA